MLRKNDDFIFLSLEGDSGVIVDDEGVSDYIERICNARYKLMH